MNRTPDEKVLRILIGCLVVATIIALPDLLYFSGRTEQFYDLIGDHCGSLDIHARYFLRFIAAATLPLILIVLLIGRRLVRPKRNHLSDKILLILAATSSVFPIVSLAIKPACGP